MNINHDIENCRLYYEIQGHVAYLRYEILGDEIDVVSTYVPSSLEGRGVASQLMQSLWDFATQEGLKPVATCSYANLWLQRRMSNSL